MLRYLFILVISTNVASLFPDRSSQAAQPANDSAPNAGRPFELPSDPAKFVGVEKCADCHNAPSPLRSTDWVRLTEFHQWRSADKHAQAFKQLASERGKHIGKVLWDTEDVTNRQECLSCHANWVRGAALPKPINLREGVTCESCHGPGADYLKPHEETTWRLQTNEQKRALGMVNVRDPREFARQCLSCHIGNAEEGKVLTHEMYAAGHPPLPGIEIETFSLHMPPHWRTLNEKLADLAKRSPPSSLTDVEQIRVLLNQPAGELHGVKSVLVGGVVTLREAVHLVGGQLAQQNATGPEFALFDCSMCHHELRTASWRQERMLSSRLTPGRPQLPRWPAALVDVAMRHAARGNADELAKLQKELAERHGALQAIFNKTPFGVGRGAEVAAAAGNLVDWLDQLVQSVSAARYDRASCEAVLIDLCHGASQGEPLDYDSARQVAWAIRTIWRQLDPPPGGKPASALLDELSKDLRLDLPWGQAKQILDPQSQQAAFTAAGNYQPQQFRKQASQLARFLKPLP